MLVCKGGHFYLFLEKNDEIIQLINYFKNSTFIWQLNFLNLLIKKIGLATERVTQIKIIEYGVSKEMISLLNIPLGVVGMIWPLVMSKYTVNNNPYMLFYNGQAIKYVLENKKNKQKNFH